MDPRQGVVKCPHCYLLIKHRLEWPADAYYQWDIRGVTLWAWCTEHACVLLGFLAASERDVARFPGWGLHKLPREIISAKNRDEVVKRITATLQREGVL